MHLKGKEKVELDNIITIAEVCSVKQAKQQLNYGIRLADIDDVNVLGVFTNCVGEWFLSAQNIYGWDQAITMIVTDNQTEPTKAESSVTGNVIYTCTNVINRVVANPYYLAFGITDVDADGRSGDGVWGSVSLVDSLGRQINRLNSPVEKYSNKEIVVEYELQHI